MTHQIPTSCLPTLLIFIHIEHICSFFIFNYTPTPPKGEGGILFYLCPSFHPSKIFFVTFFSATIDCRDLIFGHKKTQASYRYPISWEVFLDPSEFRFLLSVCRFCWFLYTFNIHLYMHIFRRIFLSNYWRQESDIWSQASYMYAILWEAFLDPSDSYFLFADFVDFYTHWTYILYMSIFSHIFLSNYWWQKSDIWSQASYRYPISWEAFFDPSDSYFLFAEEQGYHKWALAHSSSCFICFRNLT